MILSDNNALDVTTLKESYTDQQQKEWKGGERKKCPDVQLALTGTYKTYGGVKKVPVA